MCASSTASIYLKVAGVTYRAHTLTVRYLTCFLESCSILWILLDASISKYYWTAVGRFAAATCREPLCTPSIMCRHFVMWSVSTLVAERCLGNSTCHVLVTNLLGLLQHTAVSFCYSSVLGATYFHHLLEVCFIVNIILLSGLSAPSSGLFMNLFTENSLISFPIFVHSWLPRRVPVLLSRAGFEIRIIFNKGTVCFHICAPHIFKLNHSDYIIYFSLFLSFFTVYSPLHLAFTCYAMFICFCMTLLFEYVLLFLYFLQHTACTLCICLRYVMAFIFNSWAYCTSPVFY